MFSACNTYCWIMYIYMALYSLLVFAREFRESSKNRSHTYFVMVVGCGQGLAALHIRVSVDILCT